MAYQGEDEPFESAGMDEPHLYDNLDPSPCEWDEWVGFAPSSHMAYFETVPQLVQDVDTYADEHRESQFTLQMFQDNQTAPLAEYPAVATVELRYPSVHHSFGGEGQYASGYPFHPNSTDLDLLVKEVRQQPRPSPETRSKGPLDPEQRVRQHIHDSYTAGDRSKVKHTCDFLMPDGSLCSNEYESAGKLRQHRRHHDRPEICRKGCKKAFADSKDRVRHERTHTRERPFVCPHCNRSFARKDHLKRHLESKKHADIASSIVHINSLSSNRSIGGSSYAFVNTSNASSSGEV